MITPDTATYEALAKEILRRCIAEEDPGDIHRWLFDAVQKLGGSGEHAALSWSDSFDLSERIVEDYETLANTPEQDRKILTFPWRSWNEKIDSLEEGMLGLVTAPDGQGKTIYAEMIAEFWAMKKHRVVFVHYELNRKLMMLRRMARHASVTAREIKSGRLSLDDKKRIEMIRPRLTAWNGSITYLHTPGWTMERTVAELAKLHAEGLCDVVVLDYLEKVAASSRQLKMFGSNLNQREADNVEQLKNFAETTGAPVLEIAQMSKEGKKTSFDTVDRTAIRGAGENSDKANLVGLTRREPEKAGNSKKAK